MSAETSSGSAAPCRAARARIGRLEPAALRGRDEPRHRDLRALLEVDDVLLDRPADDLPARLRARLRRARATRRARRRTSSTWRPGVVATAVLFSSAFPGMFNTFVRWQFQRTYDAMLAAPGGRRGAGHRRGAVDLAARRRLRARAAARRDRLRPANRQWGMLLVPSDRLRHRLRLRRLRRDGRGGRENDRQLQLRHQRGADAAVPGRRHVLPDLQRCPPGCGWSPSSTRSTTACSWCATPPSGTSARPTSCHAAVLIGFALLMWRLAVSQPRHDA